MNYDCNQRAARSFLSVTMFSINTLSCRLLPINTCSSALALCPKGRESPDTFIPLCLGASGGLPATFRGPFPSLPHLSRCVMHRLLTPAGEGCSQIVVPGQHVSCSALLGTTWKGILYTPKIPSSLFSLPGTQPGNSSSTCAFQRRHVLHPVCCMYPVPSLPAGV